MEQPQPGDTFPVHMSWRLPDGNRLRVSFRESWMKFWGQMLSIRMAPTIVD